MIIDFQDNLYQREIKIISRFKAKHIQAVVRTKDHGASRILGSTNLNTIQITKTR